MDKITEINVPLVEIPAIMSLIDGVVSLKIHKSGTSIYIEPAFDHDNVFCLEMTVFDGCHRDTLCLGLHDAEVLRNYFDLMIHKARNCEDDS